MSSEYMWKARRNKSLITEMQNYVSIVGLISLIDLLFWCRRHNATRQTIDYLVFNVVLG